MKKVIVTGSNGFLGRALINKLTGLHIPVLAIDRTPHTNSPIRANLEYLVGNLSQKGFLDQHLDETTTVFHLAANANVMQSVENPRDDFESSFQSYFEVLESVRSKGGRIIFPSTASIFDQSNSLPVHEKSFTKPSSPYGAAKLAAEAYSFAYARSYNLDVRIARLFSVYGEGMTRFLIFDLVQRILKNPDELMIYGDGTQVRDYLHIDDAINGLILIAQQGEAGEDYNLASGIPTAIMDLAHMITQIMDRSHLRIKPRGDSRNSEVAKWYADITKIKKIGFSPEVSLEAGLKKTILWIEKHLSAPDHPQ